MFFQKTPRIAKSSSVQLLEIKSKPYYIVASVEVGNTTTKCILIATNMNTGKSSIVSKSVRMTRDVRKPKKGEIIFGKTLSGVELTRESITELVKNTLLSTIKKANLDIEKDVHFVVRSTGVVAGFKSPEEVGEFIKALAEGCLSANIPPKKMTPPMSIESIPKMFQKYSLLDKVIFDGAVASVLPPIGGTGVEIVANEMEGELTTAGIKEGAKWTDIDYRNPCVSLDFGTTLDGRITNSDAPYAKTIGNFCGYAGAIPDAIIKGTDRVDKITGTVIDVFNNKKLSSFMIMLKQQKIKEYAERILKFIIIEKVPENRTVYGSVPVNPMAAKDISVCLIGCDVGINGSDLTKLSEIGAEMDTKHGIGFIFAVIDEVMSQVIYRLIAVAKEEKLLSPDIVIGITGRAGLNGNKPTLVLKYLDKLNIHKKIEEHVVFVDDGLARGSAVMARCMNSLGTTFNPLGGNRGAKCILGARIKLQK